MRIAVAGLFNSGSTALAGMLHRLGVNMGAPFWANGQDRSPNNFYEPYDLSWHLRNWWQPPQIAERVTSVQRVRFLKCWVELQECVGAPSVGAKHPFLSLCIPDLIKAWGPEVRIIWSYRPLQESIDGLKRRGWFLGTEELIQNQLWHSLSDASQASPCLVTLEWAHVLEDPMWAAKELALLAGLEATLDQLRAASKFVKS